ncbi:sigma-70 family RNA polymerase sigma factor [Streptomyces sp. SID4917]|nr:sigma-70 family RNA polymerase sigma factor [Streptomyces sp. SID4917]
MRGVETFRTTGSDGGRAPDGDRSERFTAMYVREHPRVSAYVHRRLGDRSAAEELAAEVFRTAWERMAAGHETSSGWLFVTARNLLGNHYRKSARLTELHRRITDELHRAPASGQDTAVLDTLDRLPDRHRDVLMLSYWDGLSAAEMSEVLGCGVPAVWVRLQVGGDGRRDRTRQARPRPRGGGGPRPRRKHLHGRAGGCHGDGQGRSARKPPPVVLPHPGHRRRDGPADRREGVCLPAHEGRPDHRKPLPREHHTGLVRGDRRRPSNTGPGERPPAEPGGTEGATAQGVTW